MTRSIEMTKKEAKRICLILWRYLRDHPKCNYKCLVPNKIYNLVRLLRNECPLCELFARFDAVCLTCPLRHCNFGSHYMKWCQSKWKEDPEAVRKYEASNIVKIIEDWEV